MGGGTLSFSIVEQPSHGALALTDSATGAIVYKPAANFNGKDTLKFKVSDGQNESTGDVTITIAAVNDTPVAADAVFTTNEDEALSGTLSASDMENDALEFTVVQAPSNGSLVITDSASGAFTYTPSADFNGHDSFQFKAVAADHSNESGIASVTLNIAALYDKPTALAAILDAQEDTPLRGTLGVINPDNGRLTFEKLPSNGPIYGTVTIDENTGAFEYRPDAEFSGSDSFAFKVKDSNGDYSDSANITINVAAVNDAPELRLVSVNLDKDWSQRLYIVYKVTDKESQIDCITSSLRFERTSGTGRLISVANIRQAKPSESPEGGCFLDIRFMTSLSPFELLMSAQDSDGGFSSKWLIQCDNANSSCTYAAVP